MGVAGYMGFKILGMDIHAYGKYTQAWAYVCMFLGSYGILNHLH